MKTNSLAFRLFATAAAWILLVLPIAGAIIYSLYRQEVETSFDRRLSVLLTVVLSDSIDHGDDEPGAPKDVGEPLFEVTHSGWYWQIKPLDAKRRASQLIVAARSPAVTDPAAQRAQRRAQRARGALGQPRRPAGAEAARRRDHLRVRRGQEGAALLRRRRRHAGRDGGEPAHLPHPAHAGAGAGRRRPPRRHAVPDPLRPAAPAQGGEGPRRHPLRRGDPPRCRACRRRSSRCSRSSTRSSSPTRTSSSARAPTSATWPTP